MDQSFRLIIFPELKSTPNPQNKALHNRSFSTPPSYSPAKSYLPNFQKFLVTDFNVRQKLSVLN